MRDQAKALEKNFNFKLIEANFITKDDLETAMRTLADEQVDAVWLPSTSAIKANQDILLEAINKKKLPSVTAMTDLAKRKDKDAALIGLGPDYYKTGELAAEKALEIFAGKKPTDIPSETLKSFDMIINTKTAEKIGIKIPVGILKTATEIIQ
jgi:putative ABC transport system substrate-binding protein